MGVSRTNVESMLSCPYIALEVVEDRATYLNREATPVIFVPSSKVRVGAAERDRPFSGFVFNSTSPSRAATITAAGGSFPEYCKIGNAPMVIFCRL